PDIALLARKAWRNSETFQVPAPGREPMRQRRLRRGIDIQYQAAEQRIEEQRWDEELTDAGAIISRVYRNLRLRYVFRFEMEHLLEMSGFEVEGLYGGFKGEPFDAESGEMVW